MKGLLQDLKIESMNNSKFIVWNDNQSAGKTLTHGGKFKRTKHYSRRYSFVRDYIDRKVIEVNYCETGKMPADMLTKPLSAECQHRLMKISNVTNED